MFPQLSLLFPKTKRQTTQVPSRKAYVLAIPTQPSQHTHTMPKVNSSIYQPMIALNGNSKYFSKWYDPILSKPQLSHDALFLLTCLKYTPTTDKSKYIPKIETPLLLFPLQKQYKDIPKKKFKKWKQRRKQKSIVMSLPSHNHC